jgi:hypothetical protein
LSGIVVREGGFGVVTGELWIEAGWHPPDNHSFVSFLPVPSDVTHRELMDLCSSGPSPGSPTALLTYLEDRVEPSFRHLATPTSRQAEERLPLLDVSIMIVPSPSDDQSDNANDKDGGGGGGNFAIFSLTVSHAVGDGVTFFQILRELSVRMTRLDPMRRLNGESSSQLLIPTIDWTARSRISHELYPVSYSRRDVDVAYGLTFLVGLIKNAILTLSRRKPTIVLLDKDKVRMEKVQMRKLRNCTSLSSNDVVSLALCEANGHSDVYIFTENARDGIEIPINAGGNFFWEIPFSGRDAVADPRGFREVVESKRPNYATDRLPVQPFLCGRVGRLTSLATVVSEPIVFGDVQTVCTFPVTAFLQDIPMDIALIFRYNRQYLGVLHNFVSLDCRRCSLLDSIMVRTTFGNDKDEEGDGVGSDQ